MVLVVMAPATVEVGRAAGMAAAEWAVGMAAATAGASCKKQARGVRVGGCKRWKARWWVAAHVDTAR